MVSLWGRSLQQMTLPLLHVMLVQSEHQEE